MAKLVFTTPKNVTISGHTFVVTEARLCGWKQNEPVDPPPFNARYPELGPCIIANWEEGYLDGGSNFVKVTRHQATVYNNTDKTPPDSTLYTDTLSTAPAGALSGTNVLEALQTQKDWKLPTPVPWLPAGTIS